MGEQAIPDSLQIDRAIDLSFTPAQQDDDRSLARALVCCHIQDVHPSWSNPPLSIRISASCQLISTHGTTIPSNISQSKLHSLYCMDDIRRTGPSSNRKACLSAQGVTPSSSVSVASADSWKGCPRSVLVQMVWSLRFHPFSIRKPQLNGFVVECRNPRRYRSVILDGLP